MYLFEISCHYLKCHFQINTLISVTFETNCEILHVNSKLFFIHIYKYMCIYNFFYWSSLYFTSFLTPCLRCGHGVSFASFETLLHRPQRCQIYSEWHLLHNVGNYGVGRSRTQWMTHFKAIMKWILVLGKLLYYIYLFIYLDLFLFPIFF